METVPDIVEISLTLNIKQQVIKKFIYYIHDMLSITFIITYYFVNILY